MESKYNVKQVSNGPACVHRYYDTPCLSPDGNKLMYFRFKNEIPGPGDVIVADADGGNPEVVGHAPGQNIGHVGASAAWIDNSTISFSPEGTDVQVSSVLSLKDKTAQTIPGNVRQIHTGTRKALILKADGDHPDDEFLRTKRSVILSLDIDTMKTTPLFTVKEAAEVHSGREHLDLDSERMNFMNCKWSPDGSQFFLVFTDECWSRVHGKTRTTKVLILADADGSHIKCLGEFGHHPIWTPDGTGILAHNLKPEGQDLVRFSLENSEPEMLIEDYSGMHSTLNRAQTHVITDAFRFPEPDKVSILRYELQTREYEILCTGNQTNFEHKDGSHAHPLFSSDEQRIYFNMPDTGQPQVYCLELE
jgi:hypothetical protein